jgi:transcription termination/antitermination protein NusA
MGADLIYALQQIEKEKGISKEVIVEAIEIALISAYKKNFGAALNVTVKFDTETGEFKVFGIKKVVQEPQNEWTEVSVEQARMIDGKLSEGDVLEVEVTPRKFGRIAAQTAKQIVVQRLRDAEKGMIFEQFVSREEEIVSGIVRRIEKKNIVVELEKAEGIIPQSEQVVTEKLNFNDRIKFYVLEVKKSTKGPQIIGSRTHPGFVKRLFELEVPEIYDGTVEIRGISREAGSRTKIAVYSKEENVDPVGACVGQKGNRVQAIVDELRDEKIDIIKWSSDPTEYIASSLSPAKVVQVDILEKEKSARVIVPDFQLSLAIGKEGQNARLAAKLTGWKIDIKSQSQVMGKLFEGVSNQNEEAYGAEGRPAHHYNELFLPPDAAQNEETIQEDEGDWADGET